MNEKALVILTVDGARAVGATRRAGGMPESVDSIPASAVDAFVDLVQRFPGHLLAWRDQSAEPTLSAVESWPDLLRNGLEIRHTGYRHRNDPVRGSLGAVEFISPFVIPAPPDRPFGTWLISPSGGIASTDLLRIVGPPPPGLSFAAALLVLGHRALRQGALLWSDPGLGTPDEDPDPARLSAGDAALVVRHTVGRKFLFLWVAGGDGTHRLPVGPAIRAAVTRSPRTEALPTPRPSVPSPPLGHPQDVDVVIATMGRRPLLEHVLADLAEQRLLPRRVVVVEQVPDGAPDPGPFGTEGRPYELVYRRLTRPGACNARNLAISECRSHWVLLADDDMRYGPDYVESLLETAGSLGVDAVAAGVDADAGDEDWPRMWPYFGAGAALVTRRLFDEVGGFDRRLEGGFGEDYEWGVRARLAGAMVVHAPGIEVTHLHAVAGGFRTPYPHPWRGAEVSPVPSPTVILSHRLWETPPMRRGWAVHYWTRRLTQRWAAGPRTMARQWRAAHEWADVLEHSQDPEEARAVAT